MAKYHGTRDVKKIHYRLGPLLNEKKKKEILEKTFLNRVGYELNFDNPQTMNEKIMWMKLYYQDPLITKCADKYAVKEYVKDTIGEQYAVKTIASWNKPEDIDFDQLPDQFVLKVNWSSGYNIIVKDKSKLNKPQTIAKLKRWMQPDRNAYYQYFNWGFKHMKPVVYAEEYLEQFDGQVYDYKFFMCDGKLEFMLIATDRANDDELTHDFFDKDFNLLPVTYGELKRAVETPSKPRNWDKMVELAEKLAKPFPFVRVDFYEMDDQVFLGEMTFYPAGGLKPFHPVDWDHYFGSKINLPNKKITDKEGIALAIKAAIFVTKRKVKKFVKKVRRRIIKRKVYEEQGYIVFFNFLRIPYYTHEEEYKDRIEKYLRIFGVEFKIKTTYPEEPINSDIPYEYSCTNEIMNFQMEEKITPQMRRVHCEQKAYKQLGYFPNLKEPKTLNEKIIWLALYYKNEHIKVAADKGKAKEWIGSRIGYEHVVPLIGVYTDVNDIDFDALPNQFVAKLNDGWGMNEVMIVKDKSLLNISKTKAILSSWLYPWKNYYYFNMCITDEKMEDAAIVIEEYLDDGSGAPIEDYKIYCCNGEPKFALVVSGRGTDDQRRSFVDMDWNVLPVSRAGMRRAQSVEKPETLDKMLELSRELAKGFPFVRIDFYDVNGQVFVGEMTFTPGMFLRFSSRLWDRKLGDYLELPEVE